MKQNCRKQKYIAKYCTFFNTKNVIFNPTLFLGNFQKVSEKNAILTFLFLYVTICHALNSNTLSFFMQLFFTRPPPTKHTITNLQTILRKKEQHRKSVEGSEQQD